MSSLNGRTEKKDFDKSPEALAEVKELLQEFTGTEGPLLPALHKLQDTYGYVSHDMHRVMSEVLGIPTTQIASVQSFYHFFYEQPQGTYVIRLCGSAPCHMKHADSLLEAFEEALGIRAGETTEDGRFTLLTTGCIGACDRAPAALINDTVYGPLDPAQVKTLLAELPDSPKNPAEVSLASYVEKRGYEGLKQAVLKPESVISVLSASGLRGRSGSGFPVGVKWTTTLQEQAEQKYIVCNADEGEPETAKDHRILMEQPHAVIEGMCIAAVTVSATKGFIYLRQEYAALVPVLERAMEEAREAGYLGKQICGSDLDFDIEIRLGAGAYICGEETALLESIEGRRGTPRLKPPFPGAKGLWQKPTIINNVETLATIPGILLEGAENYRKNGTEKCPGIKLMTLSGNINRPGVYEIPIGTKVREIYEKYAGGSRDDRKLLAIQTGGQSGTIVTPEFLDVDFDIESCQKAGGFFGTGDLMFITEDVDLLDLLVNIMGFFIDESCGKCVPCRVGLVHLTALLKKIAAGEGQEEDLEHLSALAEQIRSTARCAFGTAAVTPVLSSMANFRSIFEKAVQKGGVQ